jgi:hypothetical protein
MSGELVRDDDTVVEPALITLERAAQALVEILGPLVYADFLVGKTEMRDALAARFQISQLEAEDLCDDLERADRVRFVSTPEGSAWHIRGVDEGP